MFGKKLLPGCVLFSVLLLGISASFAHQPARFNWKGSHLSQKSRLLSAFCQWVTNSNRLSRFFSSRCRKSSAPKAEYLADVKDIRVSNHAAFKRWADAFIAEQQQWCGMPEEPIKFDNHRNVFTDAGVNTWPWMVSLFQLPNYITRLLERHNQGDQLLKSFFSEANSMHRCGGTLISSEFVLTAAHCVRYVRFPYDWGDPVQKQLLLQEIFDKCFDDPQSKFKDELVRAESCYSLYLEILDNLPTETLLSGVPANDSQYWQIWVGTNLRSGQNPRKYGEGTKVLKVKNIFPYEGSDSLAGLEEKGYHQDLALLQLEEPITQFSESVRPICLTSDFNNASPSKDIQSCAVAGWGVSFDKFGKIGDVSRRLQDAPYEILRDKDCRRLTKNYPNIVKSKLKSIKHKQVVCAVENDYQDKKINGQKTKLCYGDSGGPLICKYKDDRWYQVGVLSFGKSEFNDTCEVSNSPDVFTEVPSFIKWILKTMYSLSARRVLAPPFLIG